MYVDKEKIVCDLLLTKERKFSMSTQPTIIAGVFAQESQATQALAALKQAGFTYDQIGVARPGTSAVDLRNELLDLGVPRKQASYYDQEFKAGNTIVSVSTDDGQEQQAHDLLHRYGGYDYEHQTTEMKTAAGFRSDTSQATLTSQPTTNDAQDAFYQPRSLKLRAEQLNVTKERVQSGEVALHKNVITEQQTIDVPITHEEVIIERRAITDGRVDTTPFGNDETIRVPVSAEQVNVTKNTVETGEVSIGKQAVQETQTVSDTVRHEEARIERDGDVTIQGENDRQKI
jgi:uncharacterized protein (TIGR02271 family)